MDELVSVILPAIDSLARDLENRMKASAEEPKGDLPYALKCLGSLHRAVSHRRAVFGIEPWHLIQQDVPLLRPAEYLLRLKDEAGEALPPYPAIIAFYENGFTVALDKILFLSALLQFKDSDEQEISVNVSVCSLQDSDFIKTILGHVERLALPLEKKIVIEIHETTPNNKISPHVVDLFRKFGLVFAIDDVGLSMNDVFRLTAFEHTADFIKIDRSCVCAPPDNPNSLAQVLSLVRATFPQTVIVAEGVKTVEHAYDISRNYPEIQYVQGLYLPDRAEFSKQWGALVAGA